LRNTLVEARTPQRAANDSSRLILAKPDTPIRAGTSIQRAPQTCARAMPPSD